LRPARYDNAFETTFTGNEITVENREVLESSSPAPGKSPPGFDRKCRRAA